MANVRVQNYKDRWSYVLDEGPGGGFFVSHYRYRSAEAARKAGERDAAACEKKHPEYIPGVTWPTEYCGEVWASDWAKYKKEEN